MILGYNHALCIWWREKFQIFLEPLNIVILTYEYIERFVDSHKPKDYADIISDHTVYFWNIAYTLEFRLDGTTIQLWKIKPLVIKSWCVPNKERYHSQKFDCECYITHSLLVYLQYGAVRCYFPRLFFLSRPSEILKNTCIHV